MIRPQAGGQEQAAVPRPAAGMASDSMTAAARSLVRAPQGRIPKATETLAAARPAIMKEPRIPIQIWSFQLAQRIPRPLVQMKAHRRYPEALAQLSSLFFDIAPQMNHREP